MPLLAQCFLNLPPFSNLMILKFLPEYKGAESLNCNQTLHHDPKQHHLKLGYIFD